MNSGNPNVNQMPAPNTKWSEDWVPIKNIMNGMIQLDNGYYVTGVKIASKNILY